MLLESLWDHRINHFGRHSERCSTQGMLLQISGIYPPSHALLKTVEKLQEVIMKKEAHNIKSHSCLRNRRL